MAGEVTDLDFENLNFEELKLDLTDVLFDQLNSCYRGEGNSNLVLQIPHINYVLRFHKSESVVNESDENEILKLTFIYHYFFIKTLFREYFSMPVIATVSEREIGKLDDLISHRPIHRHEKRVFYTGVEIYPDYAFFPLYIDYLKLEEQLPSATTFSSNRLKHLLSSDFLKYRDFVSTLFTNLSFRQQICSFVKPPASTFCVEIKPKQAWTAESDRHAMCFYCMNQFYKLNTNKIKSRSNYCPLDLFSGNRSRMKKAVMELIKEPQNNLRIFRNGKFIYGENNISDIKSILQEWFNYDAERCVDNLCHLIVEALLCESNKNSGEIKFTCKPYTKSQKRISCPNLNMEKMEQFLSDKFQCGREISPPKNSVLGRILFCQQLDQVGMETVFDYYETHKSDFLSEYGYVNKLIAEGKIINGRVELPVLNVVEAYLLSIVAKDLSVLITFKSAANENEDVANWYVKDMRNKTYNVNISLVDVGPKRASCVKKHWKRDANVLTLCAAQLCPEALMKV